MNEIPKKLKKEIRGKINWSIIEPLEKLAIREYRKETKKKHPLIKRRRREMFKEADGTKCPNCQVEMENCNGTLITTDFPKAMTIEHIHPTSLGGTDDSENLCVMCHACNTARAHTLSDYLTTDTDEDIRRKTQFLHVQLDNQVHAWILFPDLHKKFRKHWERLTGYEWQVGRREVEDLVTQHTNPAILPRLSREKKVTSSPRIERGGRGRRTPHRRVDMSATARARRKRKRESAQET